MIDKLAARLVENLKSRGLHIATVESCTGGLIAGAITSVSGSSAVFESGFITYSNAAKSAMVGVPAPLFISHGAVSEEVASSMARGAIEAAGADIALSVTGIAGPGGGSVEKPVGMVCLGLAQQGPGMFIDVEARTMQFGDLGRDQVRRTSVEYALRWALEALD